MDWFWIIVSGWVCAAAGFYLGLEMGLGSARDPYDEER